MCRTHVCSYSVLFLNQCEFGDPQNEDIFPMLGNLDTFPCFPLLEQNCFKVEPINSERKDKELLK